MFQHYFPFVRPSNVKQGDGAVSVLVSVIGAFAFGVWFRNGISALSSINTIYILNISPYYPSYEVFSTNPASTISTSSLSCIFVLDISLSLGVMPCPFPILHEDLSSILLTTTLPSLSVVALVSLWRDFLPHLQKLQLSFPLSI